MQRGSPRYLIKKVATMAEKLYRIIIGAKWLF
jgi:hypothetical protein